MKIIVLLLCLLLCLSGCSRCEHQWRDATCEAPKTCSLCAATEGDLLPHTWQAADCEAPKSCTACEKTEGVALGHSWQEATCEIAKTCTVCSATEGQPKGHDLQPANFQQAAVCKTCGYTEGVPLPGAYDTYPLNVLTAQIGKEYDYEAACYVKGHTTVGKLTWENYRVFTSDETHAAAEGYVWHTVTVKIVFSDKDAKKYGFQVQSAVDDYYWVLSENGNGYTDPFTVSFHGMEYDQCLMANGYGQVSDWIDNACTYTAQFAWRVPVDYDGFLILFYQPGAQLDQLLESGDPDVLAFRFSEE